MKNKKYEKKMHTYHIKEMAFVATSKKGLIKLSVYAIVIFTVLTVFVMSHVFKIKNDKIPHHHITTRYPSDLKYILFWNPRKKLSKTLQSRKELNHQEGQNDFIKQNCKFINCYATYNKSLLKEDQKNFDAIVFDIHNLRNFKIRDLNFTRSVHQKYIFRSLESSEKFPICNPQFDNFFNWTWTYKLNSDIPHPFINIYDTNNSLIGPKKKINWIQKMNIDNDTRHKVKNKIKAVAWIITKCKLKHKHGDFVNRLKDELDGYHYNIDIFGPCGNKKCPGESISKCYKVIENEYFFNLVLEDSFAEDYVTEEIIKTLNHYTIPIVLGNADYTSFLPPGSYVNVQRFDLKKLGAIIDYLIRNPKTYQYFFDWKNHYFYTRRASSYVCDLCAKLNSNYSVSRNKTYKKFRFWWNPYYKQKCYKNSST